MVLKYNCLDTHIYLKKDTIYLYIVTCLMMNIDVEKLL